MPATALPIFSVAAFIGSALAALSDAYLNRMHLSRGTAVPDSSPTL